MIKNYNLLLILKLSQGYYLYIRQFGLKKYFILEFFQDRNLIFIHSFKKK